MSESLDGWYQRELDYFRSSAAEFAQRFPKIAGRLSLGATGVKDPHVERLIQAFAYLNARIRQKLADGFPELVDAMLSVLYPHLLAPVPSMGLVQFQLDRGQKDQTGGHLLAADTQLESDRVRGFSCRFRTAYPVHLYPMTEETVRLFPRPFSGPSTPRKRDARSVLRLSWRTMDSAIPFRAYPFDRLRFHISLANFEHAARLQELVTQSALEVVICGTDPATAAAVLPATAVQPVGFADEDQLLPSSARSFPGYRLLTEYFVLPQKFLFFDVCGFTPEILARLGDRLEISILLRDSAEELENVVTSGSVRLGCTPVINLFRRTADAIPLNYRKSEYRIVADARAEESLEVFSVDNVSVEDQQGEVRQFRPFYSLDHSQQSEETGYWYATRRPGPVEGDIGLLRHPTEMYVTLVDPSFSPLRPGLGMLFSDLTCFNRDLPEELAERGTDQIHFNVAGGRGPLSAVRCLVAPTATWRRHLGRGNLWPLISQLSLNHLSLAGSEDAVDALREMLTLNDPTESTQTRNLISGVSAVTTGPCTARLGETFARGTQIRLTLEDENFRGDSAFLFASVLSRFFAMYTSINSFTRLAANTSARDERGVPPWTWPAESGNRALI